MTRNVVRKLAGRCGDGVKSGAEFYKRRSVTIVGFGDAASRTISAVLDQGPDRAANLTSGGDCLFSRCGIRSKRTASNPFAQARRLKCGWTATLALSRIAPEGPEGGAKANIDGAVRGLWLQRESGPWVPCLWVRCDGKRQVGKLGLLMINSFVTATSFVWP